MNAARRADRSESIDDTIVQWIHLCASRICVPATKTMSPVTERRLLTIDQEWIGHHDPMTIIKAAAVQISWSTCYDSNGSNRSPRGS